MNTSFYAQGWRTLLRDWRSGELRLLVLAVTLAVAALTSVSFFADRLKGGLQRDARALLGGDVVVLSDNATPQNVIDKAKELGLLTANTVGFPSMARTPIEQGGQTKLVALKAVSAGYPLRGRLTVAKTTGEPGEKTNTIPTPGEVWVDGALLTALNIKPGDAMLLGDKSFKVNRIIVAEPDRGTGFATFAPRVLINQTDLAATGLIQPASRVTYRFVVADNDNANVNTTASPAKTFANWVQSTLDAANQSGPSSSQAAAVRGVRMESFETGRPEMNQVLGRAEKFLSLVALLAALLSAVAVALAARAFAAKHLDDCAMLRVFGQSQRSIGLSYTTEFAWVGLMASSLGVVLGFCVHYVFVWLLAGLVESSLPAASIWPVLFGLGVGMTLLFAFGLPPVLQLAQVPPLRVIRRDVGSLKPASILVLGLGVLGFSALLLAASSDIKLGLIVVGGFLAAVLLFAGFSWLALQLLRKSVNDQRAPHWLVLATRQMSARPAFAVVQISALACGLLALVLLVLLRTDLISSWRKATPPDAPNRFVINIMPDQADAFQQKLKDANITKYDWYPMIRGRLVAVNEVAVGPDSFADERAKRLMDRDFNLSHSSMLPPHNDVVAGKWLNDEQGGASVEEGLAKTLNLKLGDRLRFDMGGVPVDSRVTSLRKVDWGSMRANFFVMFPVATLPQASATYMTAFRAQGSIADGAVFDNQLVQTFPNITSVDMTATVAQVQNVLNQVIGAVEFLFGFTLAAGVLVLFAAVTATQDERTKDFAIMRAMGAQSTLLRRVQSAELLGVGLLAGLLASIVAMAVAWVMARYVFEFDWSISLWVPLLGALAGAVISLMAGSIGLRKVIRQPVVQTLRAT
ncbi:MAG: ABC transporter permease [Polaromonas sp.]|nr:ABC transporter permease [Polaromonas sp.]